MPSENERTTHRRPSGALEEQVGELLAASGREMTPGEVRTQLNSTSPAPLAYSTVVTVLSRMHEKGLLTRRKSGRSFAYSRAIDPAELAARELRRRLDGRRDRDAVLSHFVEDLAVSDGDLLRRLLKLPDGR
ncbi:BlaI/MecI/CopY family transcriptional regulator [Amnibacterium sp. CER49]|uniref:BlaI/MecI/CopY family transcriptional regulator n=1 Tax=Amnibacterium sp. CER49 TaxID=3039161 RepID=UPI0024475FC7|nr:BlaI/MecI/CopY family transcriptional regulator [Amnibacterium sp. CER49]MDH2442401.1 BlaI/MecI/CopY family transcriptional regulator [Amnibacterium sp. CER49]